MARDRASRPQARPLRLFVAFDVPSSVLDALDAVEAPLREAFPRARWVPRDNRHVTLKFLGSTWPRLVDWVRSGVAETAAAAEPVTTRVQELGVFPNARRSRVLWAGLDDPDGALARLAASLDEALAREFAPEKRGFTAHLTIARFDPPVAIEDVPDADAIGEPFSVERVILYRSHLRRPAPVYQALETFPLGGR